MAEFPIAPVDRIIRKAGAERVSEQAAEVMAEILEQYAIKIASMAKLFAQHAGRKTIVPEDIMLALKAQAN